MLAFLPDTTSRYCAQRVNLEVVARGTNIIGLNHCNRKFNVDTHHQIPFCCSYRSTEVQCASLQAFSVLSLDIFSPCRAIVPGAGLRSPDTGF